MLPGASRPWRSWTNVCAASCVHAPGTLWVMQHRSQLADRINRPPQPQRVHAAPQAGADLVELDMQQVQVPEGAVVQRRTVPTRTCQPGGDGCGAVAKNPHGGGHREPFGECRQHLTHALGRRFEPIQWLTHRVPATGRKRGATGRSRAASLCVRTSGGRRRQRGAWTCASMIW
jgi:hypothetical protein